MARLVEIGVDELACLIDWMPAAEAFQGLEHLQALHRMSALTPPSARSLRAFLKSILPEYMLPASFTYLENLPLTPNGKLDRKALPAPEGEAYAKREYEAPVGAIEQALAGIWSEVLQLERVGRNDNFFELGGHSLLAMRLLERMRAAGLPVDVRTLFLKPTIAELAGLAGQQSTLVEAPPNLITAECERITPDLLPLVQLSQEEIDQVVARVPGGVRNVQDIYALSPLQEGILFHHRMEQQSDPYVLWTLLSFCGSVEVGSVCRSAQCGDCPARHSAHKCTLGGVCRSRFRWCGAGAAGAGGGAAGLRSGRCAGAAQGALSPQALPPRCHPRCDNAFDCGLGFGQ